MLNSCRHGLSRASLAALTALALLAGCGDAETEQAAEEAPRPVRVVTVERSDGGRQVQLAGTIQAQTEVNLGFRIGGRLAERVVDVGAAVEPGQLVARLDPSNEESQLRAARAGLAAAMGQYEQAELEYNRQAKLIVNGFTPRNRYEAARQALQTTRSAADAAQEQVTLAENQLSYTRLYADGPGSVTSVGAEAGEVVQAGQPVLQLARAGGVDAVFDVAPTLKDEAPNEVVVEVFLTSDPAVVATGRVREVAPRADPVTGTFRVRVSLIDPPPAMRLGTGITGRVELGASGGYALPASALTQTEAGPAVWVVDPETQTVALRAIEVDRFDAARVIVGKGLGEGDVVVTAGVQTLREGQKVRLLGAAQA